MSDIQWFPGHMLKTQKSIQAILPSIDLFIQLLDSRAPYSTRNPLLAQLARNKPKLYILNKKDLADSYNLQLWLDFLKNEASSDCLKLSLKELKQSAKLLGLIKAKISSLTKNTLIRKGRARVLVTGVPNAGKSSFINALLSKRSAQVAKKAGLTQSLQNYHFQDFTLIDSPGLLWHKWNKLTGYKLALLGAINDRLLDFFSISQYAFSLLKVQLNDSSQQKLDISFEEGFVPFMNHLALKRGLVLRGAKPDIERGCFIFVKEVREGKWGPLILESPESINLPCENLDFLVDS